MTGNVDDTKRDTGQREMRKAEVDRNTADFLLRQTICVGAGERFDQRRLPMIDVTGRGKD